MLVSTSFFASYSILTFYTVFLFALGPSLRTALWENTWDSWHFQLTDGLTMIKLFEAVYMYRHEQDLYREEETYRMIQEIIRSPGLYKLLTGSSLRGSLDPKYIQVEKDQNLFKKLKRLEKLEQRGFDVSSIKE